MNTEVRVEKSRRTVTIAIVGRFDFSCHQAFRRSYENAEDAEEYVVDLGATDYMDSSALGMLLLLREHAEPKSRVRIANCRPAVRRILEIANFHTLFAVS